MRRNGCGWCNLSKNDDGLGNTLSKRAERMVTKREKKNYVGFDRARATALRSWVDLMFSLRLYIFVVAEVDFSSTPSPTHTQTHTHSPVVRLSAVCVCDLRHASPTKVDSVSFCLSNKTGFQYLWSCRMCANAARMTSSIGLEWGQSNYIQTLSVYLTAKRWP